MSLVSLVHGAAALCGIGAFVLFAIILAQINGIPDGDAGSATQVLQYTNRWQAWCCLMFTVGAVFSGIIHKVLDSFGKEWTIGPIRPLVLIQVPTGTLAVFFSGMLVQTVNISADDSASAAFGDLQLTIAACVLLLGAMWLPHLFKSEAGKEVDSAIDLPDQTFPLTGTMRS